MVTRESRDAGFSVAELLIGMLISSLTMTAAVVMTDQVSRSYTAQLDDAVIQEEARYALTWIEDALRSAGSNPYGALTTDCPMVGTVVQGLQRDPGGDGVMDDIRIMGDINPPNSRVGGTPCGADLGEDVTIAHDVANRTIVRQDNAAGGAPVPMSDAVVTALRFTYLDINRAPVLDDAQVAYVGVLVTTQAPNRDRQTGLRTTYTLASEVRVRSR